MAPEHLFAALDSDWEQLASDANSTQRMRRCATQHQALRAFTDLSALISYMAPPPGRTPDSLGPDL